MSVIHMNNAHINIIHITRKSPINKGLAVHAITETGFFRR